ncbi:hypothetical protein V9L05_20030 [Bernardetia sp. Wsw4-3y2]|uniref:hypothetical protein n=1 Tax=Bernardetia sp. Wsw4-3y2 TaxID=3127471 RepID=UPI0030CA6E88
MARSIAEIQAEIYTEKAGRSELDVLSSNSQVSVWRLWVYIVAACIYTIEVIFDMLRIDIDAINAANVIGSEAWYVERAYEFQYSDIPVVTEGRLVYDTINLDNRIIKRASIVRLGNENANAIIKVATIDEQTNELRALDTNEITAFNGYIRSLMFAGSFIGTRSLPADFLRLYAKIYYNAIYPLPDLQIKVADAVNEYIANVPFDGKFFLIKLIDSIQNVQGVSDVEIINFQGRPDSQGSSWQATQRIYITQSGYAKIKDDEYPLLNDTQNNLTGTLTFIPETNQ